MACLAVCPVIMNQEQLEAAFKLLSLMDADAGEVLLLEIDAAALNAPLRADAIPSGELFPHLYGPLPLKAVRSVGTMPAAARLDDHDGGQIPIDA